MSENETGESSYSKKLLKDIMWLYCEVCGKPATIKIQDLWKHPDWKTQVFMEFEPFGEPHYFCKEHKRESKTIG